ncbi:MAG: polysaccharide deacetylase family protein, partial [Peptostreptococcaceae bacterium]
MNNEKLIKLPKQVEEIAEQLDTNTKKVDYTMGKKPMVTFICDDGHPNDITMLKPLAIKHNVPFVSALITDRAIAGVNYHMNLTQLKDLYNTGLWEFNSHTANHVHLPQLSEAQIREEYSKSIAYIRDNGLGNGYRFIVYPFVEFNNNVMKLTNEYFKLGIGADDKCNYTPIDSLNVKRVILGAYAPSGKDTVAYYKSRVDEIVENNGWLVFCMHTNNEGHNNTHLEEVIQYIKSINVDIVTVGQAYDYYANIMQKYYYQGSANYDFSAIGSDMNIKGMLDNNF